MFKKVSALFVVLVFGLMASAAWADTQAFTKFTIDVPADWTASQEGPTVILVANDKSASISITVDATGGASVKDLAAAFSKELGGSEPKPESESGGYEFTFSKGEAESQALIVVDDETKEYAMFVVTGDNPKIGDIINSLEDK